MTRRSLSICNRVIAKTQSASILVLFLILGGLGSYLFAAALQAPARGPKIWLGDNQAVPVKPVNAPSLAQSVAAGQAQALSMATADVDGDGVADMVAGFSAPGGGAIVIHRGNIDAFAPQSDASFQAIGRGEFPAPFLPNAQVINVPVRPDFMAFGNFTIGGHQDLVVAARGGKSLLVLSGDGKGNFSTPQTVALTGGVTAMAAEHLVRGLPYSNLVVGTTTPQVSALLVFSGSDQGLGSPASFTLGAAANNIVFGDFGDAHTDTAFLSGGNVFILHSSNFQMEALSLPVNASAMTVGSFIFDRDPRTQLALLTSDGSVQIAAHSSFDPRAFTTDEWQTMRQATLNGQPNPLVPAAVAGEGWKIVESFSSTAPVSNASQPPMLFRTRVSSNAADDLMILSASDGRMTVIAHPNMADGATTFVPGTISSRPYAGSPVAALPMRTNIDGRPGVVALHSGQLAPAVMMPLPDPTFVVNTTNDTLSAGACAAATPGQCSLREAITEANAALGVDTITVPAGTYTLTITNSTANGENANATGDLDITDGVNIVGAGSATTIIQAGPSAGTGIDKVFSVNPLFNKAFDTSFSGMTIRFGKNLASFGTNGFGGGFDWEGSHTGTMTITNVVVTDNTIADGSGGGITITNTGGGTGNFVMSNSTVSNNVAARPAGNTARGGGIFVGSATQFTISNSHIDNNSALTSNGEGGGLFIFNPGTTPISVIHGGTISGNDATVRGGGIRTTAGITIDQGAVISGNTAGDGAGLWSNLQTSVGFPSGETTTVSKSTITGNAATGHGGGVMVDSSAGGNNFVMSFSRLAGNTAPTGSNFDNIAGVVTATNNWWGTDSPATTISGTVTFDPFINLTHTASPSTIKINQSTTLTASFLNDNHGNPLGLGNLTVLIGLPIPFNNPVDGTITSPQTTIQSSATATATFNAGNVAGGGKADATVDQATVTANIIVLEPLRIVKSFSPNPVATNVPSTLSFAVTNPNVIPVDASFTDTLPGGLVVAATPGVTNTCGGTVTAVAGSGSISFSNASLPIASCTITVKVSSATDNVYNNTVTINSTAAGTGALSTSSASLTVINPPTIAKVFGAATIPLNGTTSLTFTLSSTNVNLTLNGVAFTDNLPAGLVVATPSNLNSTCSGTATAVAGSSSVSLSGASLAPGTSCTISLDVQGTTAGVKNNSVQATSTNAGTGNTSNATVTVVAPPVIIKAFGAASIPLTGSTSLTFTIQNNNTTVGLTGVGFSDTLPAGLIISTPNGLTGTCGAGTITATAGTNVISLSGGTIAASSSCTFSVNVTGTAAGTQNNTTGNVTSTEGGTGGTASASINVVAPPSIAKVFNPTTIALNGTTTLTFTITNPAANAVAETGVAFTDTLPVGLVVSTPNGLTNTCGGTATAVAGSGSISLTGGTIAVNSNCTLTVNITGTASGQFTNTSGAVTSTNGGTGNTATANLTVATPPAITKVFGVASIPLNGSTSLTFTINNPNTTLALTGLAFTDNLPAGLVVATPNALNNTCGGTATAVAGSGTVSLSGGTVASSASCSVSVNVTGTTAGIKNNSVQITSTEGGTGNTSNASITVVAPPVIIKAFGAASIPLNGSTSLTFTIQNNNITTALTGVAFSDTLPAGLVVSTPNGLTGSCGGGTVTATQATSVISLSGGTIPASSSCTFSVNVTGTTAGTKNNTTGNVTSTEGGTGGTASASVNVVAPPSIAKVFNPTSIALNATTSLTFTITNPAANAVALTGVAFTDTLPTGLTVANASATVCGGTLTTTAPTGIALTGATIAANSQCQFSVTVTGAAAGNYTNTTGNVTSTNGGTGNTATANLSVATPPTITKSFGAASIPVGGSTSLSFTINNPNTTISLTGVAFTDNLPAGLVVSTPNGLTGSCGGGTITAVAGSGSVSLSGATLTSTTSCTFSVNVTGTTGGVKNNSVQVTATESGPGNTSNASITVTSPPVIIKAFGAASIPLSGSTSLAFTIQNNNTTSSLSGVGFSDTLPAGLIISTPNGLTGSCGGGTITATQATNVISLTGATLSASTSCTFAVNVTGTAAGTQNNTTGNVTSTEGGTGGTASASINVVAPPSIAKVFNPSSIALNATTSLTFTITNPAANAVALTGVAFTDTLPTGLTVANASATVCGGTLTTTAPTGIALTGATIAANSQCQFSVTVTGAAAGNFTNTTGNVTSTNGGTGNTATANLSVATPPTITKSFGAASIQVGGSTSLSFTINNPNASLSLTGVAFTDSLPAGLVVATPNGLTGSCGGGTITAAAGSSSVSLSGATLASTASCTFSVNVTGTTAGVKNNSVQVTATESGAGNISNASITVVGPPSIAKAFGAASINLNATTTLTFTITNPNPTVALAGVAFGDTLPAGLVVATPNGLTGSCGAGTITTGTVSGFSVVNLSGGTIAAGGSCTFSVNVVGQTGGHKVNTTGTVTSTNAGSGNQATATIDVIAPDLTITKTHTGTFHRGQTGAQYILTVSNVGFGPTSGTVTVVDTLPVIGNPNNIVPTALSGTGWTCTLATLTCTRADALASGSSYPVITMTVNIPSNITDNFTNTADVSGGGDVNNTNNHASDPVHLGPPIVITPQSTAANATAGGSAQWVFNVQDDDPTLGMVAFGCSGLPVGTSCSFNPPSTNQPLTTMTMTISTSGHGHNVVTSHNLGVGGKSPLYAMFFPVLGLVGIALGGRKSKKARLRMAVVLLGMVALLSFAGCGGGGHNITTPAGTYQITVTAATATVQASTPVTLTVQ